MLSAYTLNRKEQLRHSAVSLRQHGFLVPISFRFRGLKRIISRISFYNIAMAFLLQMCRACRLLKVCAFVLSSVRLSVCRMRDLRAVETDKEAKRTNF